MKCKRCKTQDPFIREKMPLGDIGIMQEVGSDLFLFFGREWLIMVDRKSGYSFINKLHKTDSQTIIDKLTKWFRIYGLPGTIGQTLVHSIGRSLRHFAKMQE